MPRSSRPDRPSLLIAAVSGRALAAAARRVGLNSLVADFFADADTLETAEACRKLGGIGRGMRWATLAPALEALAAAAPSPLIGLVYGAGFEDRPALLARIAERFPLLGNDAATVARIKAPDHFFPMLDRLGIAHPRTITERPADGTGWLAKRIGGAGGSHVVPAPRRAARRDRYYQERVAGCPVSVLFVANGREARVLGFSEQWAAPTARSKWRYGGAVRPAAPPSAAAEAMARAVEQAVEAFQLKGLGSADFMVNGTDALLLEINPRPGATLDIFDGNGMPLLGVHLAAVIEGTLPGAAFAYADAMASCIVYAPKAISVPAGMTWPDWTADRPKPTQLIDKNRPICIVWARAATKTRAKRLAAERRTGILNALGVLTRGKDSGQEDGRERNAPYGMAKRQRQGRAARQSADR